jgi:hypothetical protein
MICKRQLVVCLLGPLLLLEVSCHKKPTASKARIAGPAQAPTLTQTLPYDIQPEPVPSSAQESTDAKAASQKPQPKRRPRTSAHKGPVTTPASPQASATSTGSSPDTAAAAMHAPSNPADIPEVVIGPDVSSTEATRDRQSTNQLLDSTENELKKLPNQGLSSDQQSMLAQIRAYINQSRKAISDGDYERASNLAKKAQLLMEELTKK